MKKITLALFSAALIGGVSNSFAQKKAPNSNKQSSQDQIALTQSNLRSIEETGVIRCLTDENELLLQAKYPNRANNQEFEAWLAPKVQEVKNNLANRNNSQQVVKTIPVIFHILTDGAGSENLSQAAVQAQVDQLNIDYADLAGSTYAVSADAEIQFCLAQRDENEGQLAEAGINRITTWGDDSLTRTDFENTIKAATQWDPTKYLNIWVARQVTSPSGALLGYAQFPSGSGLSGLNDNGGPANTDGVVVIASSVGSIANPNPFGGSTGAGRTLTHEVGHWLGLRHIWGDGGCTIDDFCADTPAAAGSNFGCPTGADSCAFGNTDPDMIENYMDYTDDGCMHTFTADQVARMTAVMNNSPRRMELASSTACQPAAPTVRFGSTSPGNINEGSSCNYQDYTIDLTITQAPSANAVASLVNNGTAVLGSDFELLNNSVTFTAANTTPSNNITLRIYEDGLFENDETISLSININTTGDAVGSALSYDLNLENDDIQTTENATQVIFEDGFETYTDFTTNPIGGWTMLDLDGDGTYGHETSDWTNEHYDGTFMVFNPSQAAPSLAGSEWDPHTGDKGYYCFNSTGNVSGTPANNDYIFTPQISLSGTGSELKFWAKSITDQWGLERFQVGVSNTDTNPTSFEYLTPFPYAQAPTTWTEYTYDLSDYDGQDIYITFHVVSTDAFVFMLDDVSVTTQTSITVQTAINSATSFEALIPGSGTAYARDNASANIMLDITSNTDHNYGCVEAYVSNDAATAGADAISYGGSTDPVDFVMAKMFTITAANTNTSANSAIDFYFTESEIAAWETATGNSRTALHVKKEGTNEVSTLTSTAFGSDHKLSGSFSTGIDGTYVFGTNQALLSVNQVTLENSLSLYPNPTSGVLNIKTSNNMQPEQYTIYNMLGQVIAKRAITNQNDLTINTSALSNGMYFIKLTKGTNEATLRFMKQ
ncbi:hypothetical protein IA57_03765 [Mangrovimonas yunxiaonensis]|uniref:Peptidase M43 pregnancy-associated plasma-A domain-containing protein n=1 Tax=Mangrovimonas yunxiaonensis TaxID=1197477 RepID=A0A084TMQ4_9FLAO|nr:M43 family zinc metalloprotease [Mangrovimonas yunxiaonensis]KFB01990.1 hypothetical protein IA57_03765 [Mangrovimonas yunxiaonensis]GGH45176.1 peptidase [Mangrovimonas yunxiaonensis]